MPTRWKLVIASLITWLFITVYTLWDLLDAVSEHGGRMRLRDTQWGPSDMKKVWALGIFTAILFVVAIAGDILTRKPESTKSST